MLSLRLGAGGDAVSRSHAQAGGGTLMPLRPGWSRAALNAACSRGSSWLLGSLRPQGSQASYTLADALQSTRVDGAGPSCPSSDASECHFYRIPVVKAVRPAPSQRAGKSTLLSRWGSDTATLQSSLTTRTHGCCPLPSALPEPEKGRPSAGRGAT